MSFLNKIANLFGPKQENGITDADGLTLKKDIKVSELKIQFNERFGSVLRVYSGRSQVNNDITLSEAGLTNEGVFNCRGNMLVGNFINKMMEDYGLKVKVYTCDEWVAVLDGLTLSASGIVKKNAVKADMEAMLSGDDAKPEGVTHVSEAKIGAFAVIKNSDGSYSVTIDGMYCANSKSAMRQIADALEFKYEAEWTTRQFGAKLSDYINKCTAERVSQAGQKQHIKVEIQIAEHDYAAFDADESMIGDTYAFNGEDGVENFELYVDGELYDFEDNDPMDIVDSKYSDYKQFDLEAKWDNEDVCSVGYYLNMALLTWEFDVDNFDIKKLSINYDCYDVCFESADYETESHILSLIYDGKTIEPSSVGCSNGDLEQIWSKYDEDDEDYEDDDDENEEDDEEIGNDEPVNDVCIEIMPDTVIDDIYVAFTLKYPHLHLRFLSKKGVMSYAVESSMTVEAVRAMLGTDCKYSSGKVSIAENRVIRDICSDFNQYGIGDTWICCHYGEDLEPEPHDSDNTVQAAEEISAPEDAPYMIAGQRKITTDGKIIEELSEPSMSLSDKFGILAATMAGIDGSVEKDEIDMVLTIIQQNSEAFDINEVRTALLKELKGIQEYESQSVIVKSIKDDDRELIFQGLIMVAVADFKLGQDELGFLSGIADLWEWDWDDCAGMIRMVIEHVQEAYGREVDVEE